jgi:hypothetical protein
MRTTPIKLSDILTELTTQIQSLKILSYLPSFACRPEKQLRNNLASVTLKRRLQIHINTGASSSPHTELSLTAYFQRCPTEISIAMP